MNTTYRMYSHAKRYFISSVNLHRQFLTQSIQPANVLLYKNNCHANACLQNNAASKRFYCQTTINNDNSEQDKDNSEQDKDNSQQEKSLSKIQEKSLSKIQEKYQKMLDEFLAEPENKKRFLMLELEIDVMRHNADKVPNTIKARDWIAIMRLPTKTQRIKFLRFLWRNEKIKENEKAEKELKKAEYLVFKQTAKKEEEDTDEMKYGLKYNTMFLRIYQSSMTHALNFKLMQAIMFEPKIVFDCGYEDHMTHRENHNCAKQLQISFASNRAHVNPMNLHFCNLKKNGILEEHLVVNIPTFLDVDFPATVTSQSYLDLFPKDQLIYFTPHCKYEMTEYDPDMVYIIGAMVDKVNPQPLSLAKAKKEGIRMLKLPINKYLEWGTGSTKNFTLNQMIKIMLDLKHTGDWNKALKNVPARKLKAAREHMMKKKLSRYLPKENENEERTKTRKSSQIQDFTFATRKKQF